MLAGQLEAARRGPKNVGRLTKREQEVLGLVVARILAKLGVRGRAEAARLAASIGS